MPGETGGIPELDGPQALRRNIDMNTGLLSISRRWLITFFVAACLAVITTYAPVVLDGKFGVTLITPIYACQPTSSGGCG